MKKFGSLPIGTALEPMEAKRVDKIPEGDWLYEPKWDGFRCLAFRDADKVDLRSKSGKPLARYFPDVVATLLQLDAEQFVLDGEIVIPSGSDFSFDNLLQRIHPAASRVEKLAKETPAMMIAFDLLVDAGAVDLTQLALTERRERLEAFAKQQFEDRRDLKLSPVTDDAEQAHAWLSEVHQGLDGVMAKRLDLPYQSGNREGMLKVKRMRTAECVVGGFRWGKNGKLIGSMLLGLYGDDDLLHHVGFCSALTAARKKELTAILAELRGGEGFTGQAPGGASRWRSEADAEWEPVEPSLVIEVQYDHFSGGRFRHGTKYVRRRPDKDPASCTLDQVGEGGASGALVLEQG